MNVLGSFKPHLTYGTVKWTFATQFVPLMLTFSGTVSSCGVPRRVKDHLLIAGVVATVAAAGRHNNRSQDLRSARVEVHGAILNMEDSMDRMQNVSAERLQG
jgi:hypothetical protein